MHRSAMYFHPCLFFFRSWKRLPVYLLIFGEYILKTKKIGTVYSFLSVTRHLSGLGLYMLFSSSIRHFLSFLSEKCTLLYESMVLITRRPVKAQVSAVSPNPSLFAHMKYGSRRRVRSRIRRLAPTGWLRMRV